MELIFDKENAGKSGCDGMRTADRLMRELFGDSVCLVSYWGPEQMCVFYMEYDYSPDGYKILIECERGFITICVKNQLGKRFSPYFIYPEADRYHFEDHYDDICELVSLTHRAIESEEIVFLSDKEIYKLYLERNAKNKKRQMVKTP